MSLPGTPREVSTINPVSAPPKPVQPEASDAMSRRIGKMKIGMTKGK